jgi:hypothetical protein
MQDENYDLRACIDAKKSSVSEPVSVLIDGTFRETTNTTTNKN